MKVSPIPIEKIIEFLGVEVRAVYGNYKNVIIDNLSAADCVNEFSLDWINPAKTNKQSMVESSRAKTILVDESVFYSEILKYENKILIVVINPKVSLAKIGNKFFIKKCIPYIHETAIIDKYAKIGRNVSIGAYAVIGKCEIGDNTIIDSNVKIYDDVSIGNSCVIKSGAVLGGAGFGFERDENNNLFRFPQIGKLIIGNHVEIGSNTCLDRGSLSDTKIGNYTKIDNFAQIAHNVCIGKNVVIAGFVGISGSCIIENNVWISPKSILNPWIHIGENSMIGSGSVVIKNIPPNELWSGNPAKKISTIDVYNQLK